MKSVSKKLFSLLLVAVLLVAALPLGVFAAEGDPHTLVLNPEGGAVAYPSKNCTEGQPVGELPVPTKDNCLFQGWYLDVNDESTLIEKNTNYSWTTDMEAHAKWTDNATNIVLKRVLDNDFDNAITIQTYPVIRGGSVLKHLDDNAFTYVENHVPAGYEWDCKWYNFTTKNQLTPQDLSTDTYTTVYVNFTAKTYKLLFVPNGGTVSPTEQKVTFGKKVGTLPTPTKKGQVFQGWFDENGVQYTADTKYEVAGDTTLTAKWGAEVQVYLRIYLDGKTGTADRIVDLTGYVSNNNVTRGKVEEVIKQYYSAAAGKTLKLDGLFEDTEDHNTWEDYKANSAKEGDINIAINESPKNVYVMVHNAKQGGTTTSTGTTGTGSTGTTSTGSSNKTDSSNPKTGDNAMLAPAAAVMVLAAAALVTVESLRKKRVY